jgi:signal transduction histidine kinase
VLGSLSAALGSVYLLSRLYPLRDRPGARWFLLVIAIQTVMCTAYAVGLALPLGAGGLRWLLEIGPGPALNLTPVLFLPHVALDTYAFVGNDMFEYLPATRRAAEQSAIDALGTPVVVLDERGRMVDTNDAARTLFPGGAGAVRTRHVADALDAEVDLEGDPQRLSVLNRVLRHNLRNDLSVAMGYVEVSADRVEDAAVREMLETAEETLEDLVSTGEKARLVEGTVQRAGADPEPVDLGDLVGETVDAVSRDYPGARFTVDGPDVTVTTNRALFGAVLEELVENACEHAGPDPSVTVSLSRVHRDGGDAGNSRGVTVTVADSGSGIPQQELETLAGEEETDLQHGSGLGLWVVRWGTELLGADLAFETGEDGTTATVRLPDRGSDGAD